MAAPGGSRTIICSEHCCSCRRETVGRGDKVALEGGYYGPIAAAADRSSAYPYGRAVVASRRLWLPSRRTAVELAAALATLASSYTAILLTAIAALVAAVSYLVWRNWSAIVKVIGRLSAAVSREMIQCNWQTGIGRGRAEEWHHARLEPAENGISRERTSRGRAELSHLRGSLPLPPMSYRSASIIANNASRRRFGMASKQDV